jgi:hypothetical protein
MRLPSGLLRPIKMTPDAIRCRVERGRSFSLSRNAWSNPRKRQRTNVYLAYFEDLSRGEIGRIVDREGKRGETVPVSGVAEAEGLPRHIGTPLTVALPC